MPIITNTTMLAGFLLAALVRQPVPQVLFATGAVIVIGVQAVSHLGNVPINRQLARYAGSGSADWEDPRPRWRRWHLARTALAAIVLLCDGVAVTLAG